MQIGHLNGIERNQATIYGWCQRITGFFFFFFFQKKKKKSILTVKVLQRYCMTFPPEAKALNCPVIWRMPKTEASITQTNTTVSAFLPFFFFFFLFTRWKGNVSPWIKALESFAISIVPPSRPQQPYQGCGKEETRRKSCLGAGREEELLARPNTLTAETRSPWLSAVIGLIEDLVFCSQVLP